LVDRRLLKACSITGKLAEPSQIGECTFTKAAILRDRLAISEVSGKNYRDDQVVKSVVVRPGVLEACAETTKSVLPSELERCAVTGKRVLKGLLVSSSLSGARLLETKSVRSAYGKFCAPFEAKSCEWSGVTYHPEDIKICSLLGLSVHFQYLSDEAQKLEVVEKMLRGTRRAADGADHWEAIRVKAADAIPSRGKCRIEAAEFSPDGKKLAVCAEVKSMLGFKVQQAGLLYSLEKNAIVGRVAIGKRGVKGDWH
jgi:hypothetical protein